MPDYCYNTINGSEEDIKAVLDMMKSEGSEFDFNRIIPKPDTIYENINCTEDWHAWATQNWGTTGVAFGIKVEQEKISFTTNWQPPKPVLAKLAELLPANTELNYKWELEEGNGAEYEISGNELVDVETWSAPGFENPLYGAPEVRKCYLAGGRSHTFVQDSWYSDNGNDSTNGYGSALETLVLEKIENFDPEDEEIAEEFWEAYDAQTGIRILDHIEETVPDLSDDMLTLMQCARDTVPAQEMFVGPRS